MFNLRSGGQGKASPAQAPTIDAIRRRARHRLMGATVLVLAAVIGLPLLFDTQPRPIAVDIPIEIPERQMAKAPVGAAGPPQAVGVQVAALDEREEMVSATSPMPAVSKAVASTPVSPVRAADVPEGQPARNASKVPPPVAPEPAAPPIRPPSDGKVTERMIVQVGAFAEPARAQDVRSKLERAGLKTYTHVAKTKDGDRIRVRLGPFDSRSEAEKAAAKVKALGLPAAILTL